MVTEEAFFQLNYGTKPRVILPRYRKPEIDQNYF